MSAMRPPQQGRRHDEIVDAILKVIDPLADGRKACRAKVVECIDYLQKFQSLLLPPPRGFEKRLANYLTSLRSAKRRAQSAKRYLENSADGMYEGPGTWSASV
jgi:hypothetical protein